MQFDWNNVLSNIVTWLTTTGIKLVLGLFILWISFKIINKVSNKIEKRMADNKRVDETIASFLGPMIRKVLKFFIIICFVSYVGVETSSIVAAITGAGLGIGLALQGALSNLAGGFIILFMRPFKVGDFITTCGKTGTVESIQMFYTTLVTVDNKVVMVPNGQVADSEITNVSIKSIRRVDLTFIISQENDFNEAKSIISRCIKKQAMILESPFPFIHINSYNGSSIEVLVGVWVKSKDYLSVYFNLLEDIKASFDTNKIKVPHSKIDVNLVNK